MTRHFNSPVLTIFSRRVRHGHEADYEAWTRGINAALAQFDGSLGATVLRTGPHRREFHTLLQFETPEHLKAWLDSPVRAEWLKKLEGIIIESEEVNSLTGLERWFTLPSQGVAQAPPKWKTALLLLIGLYPLSFLMPWLLTPYTSWLHMAIEKLALMIPTIILMVWVIMPLLTRVFFWWLYPKRK
jgi:antibiotic biosynthesis monooxygenase (ABM) superfamily enzyme